MSMQDHNPLPRSQQPVTRQEFQRKMDEIDMELESARRWRHLRGSLWNMFVGGLSGMGIVMLMVLAGMHLGR
ncbi:hypothetical protein [Mitsuaria sp. 7]|uniref:hypothetical protein n=1 Tax=Mitsuaria sp. 7 TaxID=1658665 RepID=UPI0007DDDD9A|nr:hypothetical protein [Mitsuaria sp. 7]ANH68803.1 hypothetical protein ABE85_16700 [Mitsuaria sp. 7]